MKSWVLIIMLSGHNATAIDHITFGTRLACEVANKIAARLPRSPQVVYSAECVPQFLTRGKPT